jgi:DNA-directed RNA polymerase subunit RPC12/RpoP
MTIVFHCEHCEKKISAPDEFGGKAGKCPHCHQRVFIPLPPDQLDEIPLAPEDPQDDARRKEMLREQIKFQQQINDHKEAPEPPAGSTPLPASGSDDDYPFMDAGMGGGVASSSKPSGPKMEAIVGQYLVMMSKGNLDGAEQMAEQIASGGAANKRIVEQMAMQEVLEPALANVPPSVISGYFKKLLARFAK